MLNYNVKLQPSNNFEYNTPKIGKHIHIIITTVGLHSSQWGTQVNGLRRRKRENYYFNTYE